MDLSSGPTIHWRRRKEFQERCGAGADYLLRRDDPGATAAPGLVPLARRCTPSAHASIRRGRWLLGNAPI